MIKVYLTFLFILVSIPAYSQELSQSEMREILQQADNARGRNSGVTWQLEIVSKEKGKKKEQTLVIKAKDFKFLALTVSPAKDKGRRLLMVDRNMWFIKSGLRKPVPISPRQKLMGNASNGDIASTN